MTDETPTQDLPAAGRRKTLLTALIWAMPLAALIIVIYLAIQWVAERGEVVTVTFARAGGARAGETKVMYQGVEAGRLIKIVPNKDGRRLDFKLRLIPEARSGLNTNARFYLIGASPTLDLSSLRAVVSGVAVGYAPGDGGDPADTFEGLDAAPTVLPGDRGTRYRLTAHTLGSIHEGATLVFHGQPIGKVIEVKLTGEAKFHLEVFVFQPYDALIRPGDRFWKTSPLNLAFAGGGVDVNLAPISTIFSGGIELDTVMADPDSPRSRAESEFTLFASSSAARQGLSGPTVRYSFAFSSAAGDLAEGAAVTLLGFQIGEVESARLAYDERTREPFTTVTALIYPRQLDPTSLAMGSATDWRSATDAKLRDLLAFGYRARLEQTPPLVGARSIALVRIKGVSAADLADDGISRRIPSAPGATDLETIEENLRVVTGRLRTLVSSPKVDETLSHLDNGLSELDRMLAQARPQMGPLLENLNQAAGQISAIAFAARQLLDGQGAAQDDSLPEAIRQLNEAARSVRTLADFLDRHPEALIRGKSKDK